MNEMLAGLLIIAYVAVGVVAFFHALRLFKLERNTPFRWYDVRLAFTTALFWPVLWPIVFLSYDRTGDKILSWLDKVSMR